MGASYNEGMKWLGRKVRRVIVISFGVVAILLGVVGLFLPILQGVLLILVGLYLLSRESKFARRWLERIRERFPHAYEKLLRIRHRFSRRQREEQDGRHELPEHQD
jgi:uncharacterized membrane protein YbaN (DUF454 family)